MPSDVVVLIPVYDDWEAVGLLVPLLSLVEVVHGKPAEPAVRPCTPFPFVRLHEIGEQFLTPGAVEQFQLVRTLPPVEDGRPRYRTLQPFRDGYVS